MQKCAISHNSNVFADGTINIAGSTVIQDHKSCHFRNYIFGKTIFHPYLC